MEIEATAKSHRMLFFNTLAFLVCFAAWMLNGVLVTHLVDNKIFNWTTVEIGWLLGIPVLSGSLFRLPVGMLADKFGGKWVFGLLLVFCAIPMFLLGSAKNFSEFALLSFAYGLVGTGFAVGIANTSVWYPEKLQGTALGIFGIGNAGAALTTLFAPSLLNHLTKNSVEGWRTLPKLYAATLLIMGIVFLIFTENKKSSVYKKTIRQMFLPLRNIRVWRFGLYYFLVFGCFVAFAQWLIPYFVNVYSVSIVTAGIFASLFSFPSGVIRAVGGWLSDKFGARKIMYWVLSSSMIICLFLIVPRMEIFSPGKGIMAAKSGTVIFVSDSLIKVDNLEYKLIRKNSPEINGDELIFPTKDVRQEPAVKTGEIVKQKQLLAKGTTRIYFQANLWIFIVLLTLVGISWGIGKAAVYKYIPDFFPNEVGAVGGLVGVIGGLGGFFCPIIFSYFLEWTGLWTTSWMLMFLLSAICFAWMMFAVKKQKNNLAWTEK